MKYAPRTGASRSRTILLAGLLLAACALHPAADELPRSAALPEAEEGLIHAYARRIERSLAPGESAFWLLDHADFSLNNRLALVDHAVSSLDLQYFIWEKDASSRLFARRVLHAADRGVRVRLLLDDLTLTGYVEEFAALDRHPNVTVRAFNPFSNRTPFGRFVEFAFRFARLNHRMHNKTVLADGHFAIIGGRNIGDRYFGVYDVFVQNDLDIMAVGPVVDDVVESFDLYWNSAQAFSLDVVAPRRAARAELERVTELFEESYMSERDRLHVYDLEPRRWNGHFETLAQSFAAGEAVFVHDLPLVHDGRPDQLYAHYLDFIGSAREQVIISSPYFIPDDQLIDRLEAMRARGIRILVLTNSLASNNHIIAHAGYKRWRRRLLESGIELYESRADSAAIEHYAIPPTEPGFLGLHSKAAVVDGRYSFVGSPNVDPRSMIYNTENGFFVDSVELADRVTALIERDIDPANAWRVTLDESGDLVWTSGRGTATLQPARGLRQRILEFFISLLPIKNQA